MSVAPDSKRQTEEVMVFNKPTQNNFLTSTFPKPGEDLPGIENIYNKIDVDATYFLKDKDEIILNNEKYRNYRYRYLGKLKKLTKVYNINLAYNLPYYKLEIKEGKIYVNDVLVERSAQKVSTQTAGDGDDDEFPDGFHPTASRHTNGSNGLSYTGISNIECTFVFECDTLTNNPSKYDNGYSHDFVRIMSMSKITDDNAKFEKGNFLIYTNPNNIDNILENSSVNIIEVFGNGQKVKVVGYLKKKTLFGEVEYVFGSFYISTKSMRANKSGNFDSNGMPTNMVKSAFSSVVSLMPGKQKPSTGKGGNRKKTKRNKPAKRRRRVRKSRRMKN